MKKIIYSITIITALTTIFAFNLPTKWKISEYNISFSTSGVSGIFKTLAGDILFDEKDLASSKFDIAIDISSINTGDAMQDQDAKGEHWFDAAKQPSIQFTSTKIIKTGTGFQATGDLQLHGISKAINLPFTFKRNGNSGIFEGSFDVNRVDYKIGKPGNDVGEVINVKVSVSVVK